MFWAAAHFFIGTMATKTYISLLRGINIGGQKVIKMADLRQSYLRLGFQNPMTYIQSGNVLFLSEEGEEIALAARISAQIKKDFGFEVVVIVLDAARLAAMIDAEPFSKREGVDLNMVYYTFLAAAPAPFDRERIAKMSQNGEEIAFGEQVVFLHYPNGYGRAKFSNNFIELQLKVGASTRNWRTTTTLLRMAQELENS